MVFLIYEIWYFLASFVFPAKRFLGAFFCFLWNEMLLKLPTTPKNQNKNKQSILRYFGQCPKENVILLLMSSIKPDESMRELPCRNEIELKR